MQWLKWLVITLALIQGAWLAFDGGRALVVGDYVTPASGPHAGQLGPWSRIVSALGLEPRSTFIKLLHLVLGVAWLVSMVTFYLRPAPGWWCILVCSVASLWYLPIGTVLSLIEIGLLFTSPLRNS